MTIRILIDNSLGGEAESWLFENAAGRVTAETPEQVPAALSRLAAAQADGLWAAGFLSYELGYLLEPRLSPLLPARRTAPLLDFALFDKRISMRPDETRSLLDDWSGGGYAISAPEPSIDRNAYEALFARVKGYIAAGDIYQLNLTLKAHFRIEGCAIALYRDLRRKQPVAYGALMRFEDRTILSHSPELFLEIEDEKILTRPMKGTAPRGLTAHRDDAMRAWLARDEKSRAENLMIVDLMRNDLARLAKPASVRVTDLFSVETYATLHQMTSGVEGRIGAGAGLEDILRAIFPAGSITGAPKVRAMEIIGELEQEPRGVYTGAVGMLAPGGDARFNVAIRTLVIDNAGYGEIGIGSGVVADSNIDAEYDECLLKMRFLTDPVREFELIETLRFDAGIGYYLLDRHLERLRASAAYFGYPVDIARIQAALDEVADACGEGSLRVRLLLARDGAPSVTSVEISPAAPDAAMRYMLSGQVADSGNVFLYHKTTIREFYDDEHARLSKAHGVDEVIFVNERGELTEGSRTNIFVERDGILLTPPVSSGLLSGTLRAELLQSGKAREEILTPRDLESTAAVFLGNSVRGLLPAVAIPDKVAQAAGALP